jgi:hypothetical protein
MGRARSLFHAGRYAGCLCLAAAFTMSPLAHQVSPAPSADPRAEIALHSFLDRTEAAHQYSASRRLEASGSGRQGWLDARIEYSAASGFSYQVMAEGGSGYIRSRVLRSLLEEERSIVAENASARVALSYANYQFTPQGLDEEGLAVVTIKPLRKDRSLIAGQLFLTAEGDLVRVKGRLVKNPSFWVTRANLIRSYQRINGVTMPVSLETTGQLRLFGSSALRMTYRYEQINDRIVEDEDTNRVIE